MTRRFPPPWSVEEQEACYTVRDHNRQQLAYVYFEEESRSPVESGNGDSWTSYDLDLAGSPTF
jgi:hypothetical protein